MHWKTVLFCCLLTTFLNYLIVDAGKVKPHKISVKVQLQQLVKKYGYCKSVFYKRKSPSFRGGLPSKYKCLCRGYYQTCYDTGKKLPVHSAYTLPRLNFLNKPNREEQWLQDPSLTTEEQQQTNAYYGIGKKFLDRGHLYPQFYNNIKEKMRFTNLLSNIALQYSNFNKNTWYRLEKDIFDVSAAECNYPMANRYFVTGVIPSKSNKYDKKINIPLSFWTAVCCDTSLSSVENRHMGWSFAYMVRNLDRQSLTVSMYSVEDFLGEPNMSQYNEIFTNFGKVKHCLFNTSKAANVVLQMVTLNGRKDTFIITGQLVKWYNEILKKKEKKVKY